MLLTQHFLFLLFTYLVELGVLLLCRFLLCNDYQCWMWVVRFLYWFVLRPQVAGLSVGAFGRVSFPLVLLGALVFVIGFV